MDGDREPQVHFCVFQEKEQFSLGHKVLFPVVL